MISKRIKFIASLLDANDKVLDVGTDHALLPIYLVKNNLVKKADGSDISNTVLDNARKNLQKYNLTNKINLFCTDGVKDIDINEYDTLVITGMGFYTIKGILDDKKAQSIDKMIIQTNNNYEDLRRYINSIGFKIVKDVYILDKKKTYLIIMAEKGTQELSENEYICGLFDPNNMWYYRFITNKLGKLLKGIPKDENSSIKRELENYKKYLAKEKIED